MVLKVGQNLLSSRIGQRKSEFSVRTFMYGVCLVVRNAIDMRSDKIQRFYYALDPPLLYMVFEIIYSFQLDWLWQTIVPGWSVDPWKWFWAVIKLTFGPPPERV